MNIDINQSAQVDANLESAIITLKQALPNLPSAISYQGFVITPAEILKSLQALKQHILDIQSSTAHDAILLSVHFPNVINVSNTLPSLIAQFVSTPSSPYIDNLVGHIWSLYSSIHYLTSSFFDSDKIDGLAKLIAKTSKTGNVKSILSELDTLNNNLKAAYNAQLNSLKNVDENKEALQAVLIQAQKDALEIANAKTNSSANASDVSSAKLLFDNLLLEVKQGVEDSNELSESLDKIKEKAQNTLSTASQLSLAQSFNSRKVILEQAQKIWVRSFILGLLILFGITLVSVLYPDVYGFPPIVKGGIIDIWGLVSRFLITTPVIWFTWFTVRMYSNNISLIEDYAFKEASAYAFVGYKKDIDDDPDMLSFLRESAIKNFSYPPSRFLNNGHVSPTHELFEKALSDNTMFDKLVKMIEALKPSK